MNEITLRYEFKQAGTSPPYRVAGPGILMQTSGPSATLQGSNLPDIEASWQTLGVCNGFTPLTLNTPFAFIRAVVAAACIVAVSGANASIPMDTPAPTIPVNAVTLGGDYITLGGDYVTLGA